MSFESLMDTKHACMVSNPAGGHRAFDHQPAVARKDGFDAEFDSAVLTVGNGV